MLIGGCSMAVAVSTIACRTSSGCGAGQPVKSNVHEHGRAKYSLRELRAAARVQSGTGCG